MPSNIQSMTTVTINNAYSVWWSLKLVDILPNVLVIFTLNSKKFILWSNVVGLRMTRDADEKPISTKSDQINIISYLYSKFDVNQTEK